MTDFWTEDRIETMRTMRANGATGLQIGLAIGCSRSAVLGKMDRIGMSGTVPRTWTPERVELLKSMHAAGKMFPAIAEALSITPRAARAKADKLDLERRDSGYYFNPLRKISAPRVPSAFKPRLVADLPAPSTDLAASIVDATGCLWAITPHNCDKAAHMFCNHPKAEKGPYCEFHAEMNRVRPEPKQPITNRRYIPTTLLRSVA